MGKYVWWLYIFSKIVDCKRDEGRCVWKHSRVRVKFVIISASVLVQFGILMAAFILCYIVTQDRNTIRQQLSTVHLWGKKPLPWDGGPSKKTLMVSFQRSFQVSSGDWTPVARFHSSWAKTRNQHQSSGYFQSCMNLLHFQPAASAGYG